MGRFFGRRPDRTPAIARALRTHLDPGEEMIAGVDVQRPGTTSAATGTTVSGNSVTFRSDDEAGARWMAEAAAIGLDANAAHRLTWAAVALTSSRLIVIRRSRLTGRLEQVLIEWPVDEIDRIEVPRQGRRLTIHRHDQTVTFELALDRKFRPVVYDELPQRLEAVKAQR